MERAKGDPRATWRASGEADGFLSVADVAARALPVPAFAQPAPDLEGGALAHGQPSVRSIVLPAPAMREDQPRRPFPGPTTADRILGELAFMMRNRRQFHPSLAYVRPPPLVVEAPGDARPKSALANRR